MDTAFWSPLERPSGLLPIAKYVLAAIAILGRKWRLAESLENVSEAIGSTGLAKLGGSLFRREFRFGKKRGLEVGKTKRGKGSKWMVVVDGEGIPIGSTITSASPAEVTLIEPLLDETYGKNKITRLIYDKAADSDPLRNRLRTRKIELICPHRKNRKKRPTQDGRPLRRYARRWKVERTFAWLGNFRRLVVRWEKHVTIYRAFFHIACMMITLNKL